MTPAAGPAATASSEPGPLPITALARRLGHYQWVEMRLFEIMGAWVPVVPEPDAKLLLARHAAHHGWHAELWAALIPDLRFPDPAALVAPASADQAGFFEALALPEASADPARTLERLAGAYRVLSPHLIAVYSGHLAATRAVADGPVARVLRLVLADEAEDGRQGDALLAAWAGGDDEAARAAGHAEALAALLADSGPAVFT